MTVTVTEHGRAGPARMSLPHPHTRPTKATSSAIAWASSPRLPHGHLAGESPPPKPPRHCPRPRWVVIVGRGWLLYGYGIGPRGTIVTVLTHGQISVEESRRKVARGNRGGVFANRPPKGQIRSSRFFHNSPPPALVQGDCQANPLDGGSNGDRSNGDGYPPKGPSDGEHARGGWISVQESPRGGGSRQSGAREIFADSFGLAAGSPRLPPAVPRKAETAVESSGPAAGRPSSECGVRHDFWRQ